MREATGNIWDLAGPEDIICITTNGYVKRDGRAVMGRGIAFQATQRDPEVAIRLGNMLQKWDNRVHVIHEKPLWLSFPVKKHWKDQADLELIEQSTKDLVDVVENEIMYKAWAGYYGPVNIYLPRPGCGNGRLKWEDVKPVIEPYLDDRFIVVTNEEPT